MQITRYLECLATDYNLLRDAVSSSGLDRPVPSCPDWTAADLVTHVGHVYLHKAAVLRDGKWPDPFPPQDLPADPLAVLDQGHRELRAEEGLTIAGDPAWAAYLRRLLAAVTG